MTTLAQPTFTTAQQLNEQAAAAGFKIGDYVHHPHRDYRASMPIESFDVQDGVLVAVLMCKCVRAPLSECRLSTGHQRRADFGEGYEFFTSAALLAEVQRQAQVTPTEHGIDYTGAWVKGFGTEQPELWLTAQPHPSAPETVFSLYSNAPWPTDPA